MSKSNRTELFGAENTPRLAIFVAIVVLVGLSATGSVVAQQNVDSCTELGTPGEVYELNQSIANSSETTCLRVTANDTVVNGNGFSLDGVNRDSGRTGIRVTAYNVTVENFGNVTGWELGLVYDNADEGEVTSNLFDGNDDAVTLRLSEGNSLAGNTLSNGRYGFIFEASSSDNNLTDNTVRDNSQIGILLRGNSDSNYLTRNVVTRNGGNTGAIRISSGTNNLLEENTVDDNQRGIRLDSGGNVVRNNTVTRLDTAGAALPIDSDNNVVRDNNVSDNPGDGIRLGIGSTQRDDNQIVNNTVLRNGMSGIFVTGMGDNNVIRANIVEGNDGTGTPPVDQRVGAGVEISGSTGVNNTITGNSLNDNVYGVVALDASGLLIENNEALENEREGVWFNSVTDTVVRNNDISNNTEGVEFQGANQNDVTGNSIESNDELGVRLAGSASNNNYISSNIISDNGASGTFDGVLLITNPEDNKISENSLTNNTGSGVRIASSAGSNNTIHANNATENRRGVEVGASGNNVTDNQLDSNLYGAYLTAGSNTVARNTANNNGRDGFYLSSASYSNLTDNTANDNGRYGIWSRNRPVNHRVR